jgi:hypothetical protein
MPSARRADAPAPAPAAPRWRVVAGVVRAALSRHPFLFELVAQIIFTDQYHDRFVDEDAHRLLAHPPKVIVIGPRDAWRPFSRIWHQNVGAERLIDRIQADLLPARYSKAAEVAISYLGKTDHMDVFLLNPEAPPPR